MEVCVCAKLNGRDCGTVRRTCEREETCSRAGGRGSRTTLRAVPSTPRRRTDQRSIPDRIFSRNEYTVMERERESMCVNINNAE